MVKENTEELEGTIVKIESSEEPALIHIRLKGTSEVVVYCIDNLQIKQAVDKNNEITFKTVEPFARDKK